MYTIHGAFFGGQSQTVCICIDFTTQSPNAGAYSMGLSKHGGLAISNQRDNCEQKTWDGRGYPISFSDRARMKTHHSTEAQAIAGVRYFSNSASASEWHQPAIHRSKKSHQRSHGLDAAGVWMLKDDATIGRIYAFLGRSCCKPCTEQWEKPSSWGGGTWGDVEPDSWWCLNKTPVSLSLLVRCCLLDLLAPVLPVWNELTHLPHSVQPVSSCGTHLRWFSDALLAPPAV